MLSVLHISAWDNFGGSGRAAYRVHLGLKGLGVRSRMLVGWKAARGEADEDVDLLGRGMRFADRLCNRVTDRLGFQYLATPSSVLLPYRRWVQEADVIQLYNTHGGYFSHTVLPALSRRRPVVWRLSDMWPMTGHCIYSYGCDRWKHGCGACPILGDYPSLRRDTTALLWRVKRRVYRRSRLTIVTPSRWMAGLAGHSPLLNQFPIHVIPNGLDADVFHPVPKLLARAELGIEGAARILMFSAHFVSDRRKGGVMLAQALAGLSEAERGNLELLVVGQGADQWEAPPRVRVRRLGAIRDDRRLATVYAAADLFVLPALADNLPNGILESMACGTPVLSCSVGGIAEAVRHRETGYLAAPEDQEDLANGLRWLLRDEALRERMGRSARAVIERDHTLQMQATRFLELYQRLIDQPRAGALPPS